MLSDFADVFGAIHACMDEAKTQTSETEKLRARIAELEVLLKDCADELEARLDEDYKRRTGRILFFFPEYRLKYERDMAPVIAARAALNGEKG